MLPGMLAAARLKMHLRMLVTRSWKAFLTRYDSSLGLLHFLPDNRLLDNPIPLSLPRRTIGALCSLLSGHCGLLSNAYVIGRSFSPTCVCLRADESVAHYLFECPLFTNLRVVVDLDPLCWASMADFLQKSARLL